MTSSNTTKGKNRRSRKKYPALEKTYNLKSRSELIDFDYIHKLNDDEKKFLNDFVEGWVNGNPLKEGTNELFTELYHRRECYAMNYARYNDILTQAKVNGRVVEMDAQSPNKGSLVYNPVDKIITKVDKDTLFDPELVAIHKEEVEALSKLKRRGRKRRS